MSVNYHEIIEEARKTGGLYDAMLAVQAEEGYLSEPAILAVAEAFGATPSHIYDTASFYSMIHFSPKGEVQIEICRGAPCHVAGSAEVIKAIENYLGIRIGGRTPDGKYSFTYTECIGQCQASPSVLINGKLYTEMDAGKIIDILEKGEWQE